MENILAATALSWIDGALVACFFVVIICVGSYFHKWIKKPEDFYVAGRQLTPFILVATLAATNCSLYNFQSYVGYAYREGMSIIWHEWTGMMALVFAGIFILPILRRLKIATIPELLGRRYNSSLQSLVAVLWSLRFCAWLGCILYLSAQIACIVTGFDDTGPAYHAFIFFFGIVTIAYTMAGGMWAVVLTDVIQFVFLLGGALVMIPLIMHTVGYWQGMEQTLTATGRQGLLNLVPSEGFWNWKGGIGISLLAIQWACTDQPMLQRALGANSVKTVAKAMVYAGIIMVPLAFIIPMPGIAAAIKVSQGTMPAFLEQDNALPMLLASGIVPTGILGLILCGLLASQLSTIDSALSSSSTLVTLDVINVFRKRKLTDRQMLFTLRLMILLMGAVMILTSYMAKNSQSAVDFYIAVVSVVDLPVFVVAIIYGLFYKRATATGAITGYVVGMLLGLVIHFHNYLGSAVAVFVDGIYKLYSYLPLLGEGVTAENASGWDVAVIGMIVTAVTVPVVSLFTKQTDSEQVSRISQARYPTKQEHERGEAFYVWPVSLKGRTYIGVMFVGLAVFFTGLILGKYPEQTGYGISMLQMHRFEQTALLIPADDLPPDVSVESRRALLDDMITLSKNTDETDERRRPLADALVPRMKDLMKSYCAKVKANPDKYGDEYLDEFNQQLESVQAGPGRTIRENSKAGPAAFAGMLIFLFGGLMRMRYD